ncbi:concanavalin A-like lectin/glucanase [Amylostereum chailletii]|nr:concanavalin A-like lectin/glucanase [Amylostereum chailletii]
MRVFMWPALLLNLFVLGVIAQDSSHDGTRIANRTIERTTQLRTHSLFAPYIDQDLQNRWWDFGGDAYINTNKHVRLTRSVQSQMGWLWSRLPLTAHNWIIELEFKIGDKSTHLYGDGLALWLTKDRAQPGPIFGSKDNFDGLGVFLDTYANGRHGFSFPRVVGIMGDGNTPYDSKTDGESQKLGACSANFRRTNVATKLKVTYVKDTMLDVKIQYKGWDDWTDCFSVRGITLPPNPYVGFSALTGDVHDPHDVISVSTYSAVLSAEDSQRNQIRTKFASSSGSFSWLKVFLFVGVCAGGWYGWKMYGQKKLAGFSSAGGLSGSGGFGGFGGMASPQYSSWQDSKRF